jgi:hypothetical protein
MELFIQIGRSVIRRQDCYSNITKPAYALWGVYGLRCYVQAMLRAFHNISGFIRCEHVLQILLWLILDLFGDTLPATGIM